jgi:hypothetical protein
MPVDSAEGLEDRLMGCRETLVGIVGALLLVSTAAATFAKAPAAEAQQPPPLTKFVTPLKGEVQVEFTEPQARQEGNMVVTRIKVKNSSKGPIGGFKVDEYWYNAKGDTVSGSPTFRVLKPMMPGDIVEVVLKSPKAPDMARVNRIFGHANGTVKPKKVAAFKKDS